MKKTFTWLVATIGLFVCLYLGFYQGITGAQNLVYFWIWLTLILSFFTLERNFQLKQAQKDDPTLSYWITFPIRMVIAGTLIWYGAWITAIAYALALLIITVANDEINKKRARLDNNFAGRITAENK